MSTATTKQPEIVKQPEQQFTVKYTPFGEKNEITLSVDMVAKFISARTASGKVASHNDIVTFMMLCKSSGLNPWIKDAYLIGYDSKDGPTFTLIVAHQSLLKRAELSSEFDGIESGVVVIAKGSNETIQRPGTLVLPGETLVGGWAAVYRRDRSRPSSATVSLATYSTGRSRWSIDPAGMIAKVAEGSALRKAFPSTLTQCYLREEFERDLERGESQSSHRSTVTQQQPTRLVMSEEALKSKSDAIAKLLSQRSESIEVQQDAQQRRDEIEDQEPERQPLTSTLRECDAMLQAAGIDSTEAETPAGPYAYLLPDGLTIKIGNGLDETKSRKGLAILDAMKAETPQIVREMIELSKAVKK
jgi:phage recombination protein Bet